MHIYTGKTISSGIAVGTLFFYNRRRQEAAYYKVEDTEAEIKRYEHAKELAVKELNLLYEKALQEAGENSAAIFEVHAMMLEDGEFSNSVKEMIKSGEMNAEQAVSLTEEKLAGVFSRMEDAHFRERAADIRDIAGRVMAALLESTETSPSTPVIAAAKELLPSEVVRMEKGNLLGFVTFTGSENSHTAILARNMGIPAVSGIEMKEEWAGKTVILDGTAGTLIVDPDEETLESMKAKKGKVQERKHLLQSLKGRETATKSGRKLRLYANAGSLSDVAEALENDAEGIGLFRSEFLYLGRDSFPMEEEQFQVYKAMAEKMAGKGVVIRTMDVGADKQADYFGFEKEENPAMGYRGIRICLDQPEIFKIQLRAIYRAGVFGNLAVMYPMITSVEEVWEIKKIIEEVKEELGGHGIAFKEPEQGIMIETPAAAIISDELAKEVDFFSIGTNDLSQYTLAADRQNEKTGRFYNPYHPAVFRLIEMTIVNGHKNGCRVSICGEMAADLDLTEQFIQMGIDELSVSPKMILPLRQKIREITY